MKQLVLTPDNHILIKISNPPRCGSHFLDSLLASLPAETYGRIADRDIAHNFKFQSPFWNLVTILRDPIDALASHATLIFENKDKMDPTADIKKVVDMSTDAFNGWYQNAINFQNHFFYIFDFELLTSNTNKELNKFLDKLNLPDFNQKIESDSIINSISEASDLYIKTSKKSDSYEIIKQEIQKKDISLILDCYNILLKKIGK